MFLGDSQQGRGASKSSKLCEATREAIETRATTHITAIVHDPILDEAILADFGLAFLVPRLVRPHHTIAARAHILHLLVGATINTTAFGHDVDSVARMLGYGGRILWGEK